MNIVIIGAGSIGAHLAMIFSQEDYRILLVDNDPFRLDRASRELDIATRVGDAADWELLEEMLDFAPDLLIALTNDDEKNLVSCNIAKQLGYPQTIARVRKTKYFMQSRLNFEQIFCVDHLIGPEKLTADAISNMILMPGSVAIENFAHGQVQLRTVKIPPMWRKEKVRLSDRNALEIPNNVMVGLIRRKAEHELHGKVVSHKEQIIFPHGNDVLLPGDEVTFIGETSAIRNLHRIFGVTIRRPRSVMIVGGSLIGSHLSRCLRDHHMRTVILEKDFNKCSFLAEILPHATIVHRDGLDYDFLEQEKAGDYDVFVACTRNDETNFLSGAIARNLGCENVIISLADTSYQPLTTQFKITQAASPRVNAANRILSIARKKTIASMVSMYNNQAEIMEVKVSLDSKLAGIPIRFLGPHLPDDMLIVVIQSRGRVFIADGNRVLTPGDTVIVISSPKHVDDLRKLF
ncbi:MAG: Trk system potassium transporter TrkA [Chlamydiales bacterium]|nr:Trk system potassium transporter TrkA [Chlamydiales bacterium]